MNSVSVENFIQIANAMKKELSKVIVGQEELVHNVLITLFAGGHALLEGVPGLGKTLLIRTLSQFMDGTFSRIQFTPDLMPADIIGTVIISETPEGKRELRFEKGPIFAHLVLADEINRATPRTQSALLEAMQENHVTVSGTTYALPRPFFVLATKIRLKWKGHTHCRKLNWIDFCTKLRFLTLLKRN
jgi:MoxR-like ATPase